jgi:Lon protease-like protein
MRRELPPRASLEHLKKQAKDLLDGHRSADPRALARIRDSVPAFAKTTDEELARAPFALHDAQSAIAREYGTKSWSELREAVAKQLRTVPPPTFPPDVDAAIDRLRALLPLPLTFPPEAGAALREASERRALVAPVAEGPLAPSLPLVAMRNALFLPRALGPIHVGRPSSRAALDAAIARTPPTLAVFAQRTAEEEDFDAAGLHPVGCEVYLHALLPAEGGRTWAILEGVRWIALESLEAHPTGYRMAHVTPVLVDTTRGPEVDALAASLRALARDLASTFPDAPRLLSLIDAAEPDRLADLIVTNLPVPVEDKARYAAEPLLSERLRIATALAGQRKVG